MSYVYDEDGTKHYAIQSDHLNTPRRLIQSDGQVAWQWAYSAFGEEKPTIARNRFANTDLNQSFGTTNVPAVTFNLRYPGQYYDQETGLHYNWHRSYDAGRGRYTQADPIGLDGGWNRFGYVGGNALSFSDPEGLAWSCKTVGLLTTCSNTPPWNPDLPPGYNPPSPGLTWPNWMGSRSAGKGEEARPPDVNPGKDCNGQCMPCPKNPSPFDHNGDAHGTDRGFHTHQWQYHQAPDCTCRARKVSW